MEFSAHFPESHTNFLDRQAEAISIAKNLSAYPMAGWLRSLAGPVDQDLLAQIQQIATHIQQTSKYLVCVGIGGSYLGHRAIIEALKPASSTQILYAGHHLSARQYTELLETIGDADFSLLTISKSGTTLETTVAHQLLKTQLMDKYQDQYYQRIFVITDTQSGKLIEEARQYQYTALALSTDIGGRFSVFTAVGLLPMAVAGINIAELLSSARQALQDLTSNPVNSALTYALARQHLLQNGYHTEVLASFEPCLHYLAEWWKQLFGESEGKQHQGLFPASLHYSTDLHSLGQYMQDGDRHLIETFLRIKKLPSPDYSLPKFNKTLGQLNQIAESATISAHQSGGLPVFELSIPDLSVRSIAVFLVNMMYACVISATLANLDPYDQPGVEAYKQEIQKLLN